MTQPTPQQRALRGVAEGAATGFAVAAVRTGIALFRKDVPENIGAIIPELLAYFLVVVLCCSYIFAVGRAIADGIAGSLLGAAVLAISGILVGTYIAYAPTGPPYPLFVAGGTGVLIGSPLGAAIHQQFNKRSRPGEHDPDI